MRTSLVPSALLVAVLSLASYELRAEDLGYTPQTPVELAFSEFFLMYAQGLSSPDPLDREAAFRSVQPSPADLKAIFKDDMTPIWPSFQEDFSNTLRVVTSRNPFADYQIAEMKILNLRDLPAYSETLPHLVDDVPAFIPYPRNERGEVMHLHTPFFRVNGRWVCISNPRRWVLVLNHHNAGK